MAEFDVVAYLASKGLHGKQANGPEVAYPCFMDCGEPADSRKKKWYLNTEDGFYQCKVCGAQGGTTLLQRHFGDEPTKRDGPYEDSHTKRKILNWAAEIGVAMLANQDAHLLYLCNDRGLSVETILERKLGWVGNNWSLTGSLPEQFTRAELATTGLVYRDGPRGGQDFFYDHLLIPYLVHGNVVQIRGRATGVGSGAKYLTGPGEPVRLFNTDSLDGADDVIVTEGELDCAVLAQHLQASPEAKVRRIAVVGLAGANGFKDGMESYFTNIKRVFLGLDPDDTGRREAVKIRERLGARARILELPAELPKADWSEWLLPIPAVRDLPGADFNAQARALDLWRSLHPHAGHTWRDVIALFGRATGKRVFSMAETGQAWRTQKVTRTGIQTGYLELDKVIAPGGLPGQMMVILAKTSVGKQAPDSDPILTPAGVRLWGDLRVGDDVWGANGSPTTVVGVFPQGEQETWKLTFSDHTTALAGPEHLWRVGQRGGKTRDWQWSDMTTVAIERAGLRCGYQDREYRFKIPIVEAIQWPDADLPIGPYTLGALLANGALQASVVLSTPDAGVAVRCRDEGHLLTEWSPASCTRWGLPKMAPLVRALGLNVKSGVKFIPEQYLRASVKQRIALLQGLMDGDGSAPKGRRAVLYHTTSARLSRDVVHLVQSLGGTACVNVYDRTAEEKGIEFRVNIMLPAAVEPFSTGRKVSEPGRYTTEPRRTIVSIERTGIIEPQTCIQVAAPDQLYCCGTGFVVTHNTVALCNMAYNMRQHRQLFISLEMTREEVYERLQRIFRFYTPFATDDEVEHGLSNIWICDQNRLSDKDFVEVLDEYRAEVDASPEVVHVDYLGYFARGQRGNSQYEKVTNAAMQLKAMAKHPDPDKRFFLIVPSQTNRLAKEGKPIDASDSRDSGAVEETADFLVSLWRPDDALHVEADLQIKGVQAARNFQLFMTVLKSRHGGKDTRIELQMDMLTLVIVQRDSPASRQCIAHNLQYAIGTTYDQLRAQQLAPVQQELIRRDLR